MLADKLGASATQELLLICRSRSQSCMFYKRASLLLSCTSLHCCYNSWIAPSERSPCNLCWVWCCWHKPMNLLCCPVHHLHDAVNPLHKSQPGPAIQGDCEEQKTLLLVWGLPLSRRCVTQTVAPGKKQLRKCGVHEEACQRTEIGSAGQNQDALTPILL